MNNSALQKIAYKAGVTRVSSDVYDIVRNIGNRYLNSIVRYAIIYCEYENKKVVLEDHVIRSIEHVGFSNMYRVSGDIKACKTSKKKNLLSRIKEYQDQHDCVTLAKAPIITQIKIFGKDFYPRNEWRSRDYFKWSKEALINIQFALEFAIYKLLNSALKITINSKRVTMQGPDVKLAIDLINDNCKNNLL